MEIDGQPTSSTRSRTSSTSSSSNLIDANNRNASTAVMEKLQTQMRQKDGEIHILKVGRHTFYYRYHEWWDTSKLD